MKEEEVILSRLSEERRGEEGRRAEESGDSWGGAFVSQGGDQS